MFGERPVIVVGIELVIMVELLYCIIHWVSFPDGAQLRDADEDVILLDVNKLGDGQVEHELTSNKSIAKSPV